MKFLRLQTIKNCKKIFISNFAEYFSVFLLGGGLYYLIEMLWRGHSHFLMFLAGGSCLAIIYFTETRLISRKLLLRCIVHSISITTVEFIFGLLFNIVMGLAIWDYSDMPYNIMGQVCPYFVLAWFALSLPAVLVCSVIRRFFMAKRNQIA